jgi:hypothetical protein
MLSSTAAGPLLSLPSLCRLARCRQHSDSVSRAVPHASGDTSVTMCTQ